ncbi:MAG: Rnase Y domain-containing protein [Malacoplasma sp.]
MNNDILYIVALVIIIALFIVLAISLIVFFINKKKKNNIPTKINNAISNKNNIDNFNGENDYFKQEIDKSIKENELLKKELQIEIKNYKLLNEKLQNKLIEETNKLETISSLTAEEAEKLLFENIENRLVKEKNNLIKEFNNSNKKILDEKATSLLIDVIERSVEDTIVQKTSFTLKLSDDNIKGRIIGKDGRNKKAFEYMTGVDLIIEKDPEITLSCLNPIRREIGRMLLEKLLLTKNIEPSRIEKLYDEIQLNFESSLYDAAESVIENELNIFDINKNLYPIFGRLKYRTSYGQNNLHHIKECAFLASAIAIELGLDPNKAKKAALFHDIGKAIDFELDNDHVESGLKLAIEYNLEPYIINAIESHHDKIATNNIYSTIVKIVDKISASRPGARFVSHEEYVKRLNAIEEICNSFPGVKNSYAIKAGKQVRIIVNPSLISDDESASLIFDIKSKLENNDIVNKQPIDIILIRENRFEVKSDGSAKRLTQE